MRILSRFALLSSSLFFLLLIGNALQARGVTLFDNYTSVGFQINQGATISGIDSSIKTYLSPSASFISSQTAYLSDIDAPLSLAYGTNSVSFDLKNRLYGEVCGNPRELSIMIHYERYRTLHTNIGNIFSLVCRQHRNENGGGVDFRSSGV